SPSGYAVAIGPAQHDAPLRGALAASGTATAELAVDLVPLTVFYRVGLFEWILAHIFVTAPWISIANLVLGRTLLTERVCWRPDAGEDIGADFLAAAGTPEAWTSLRAGLREVRERLETPHVATRAAGWLLAETAAQRKGAVAAPGQAASPAGGPA
ncbi:MAG: hypothetical protein QNJ90_09360, partial [Planctomycetota bacterium]|nr:hypothetical protein [Planctomycetota bacterium]